MDICSGCSLLSTCGRALTLIGGTGRLPAEPATAPRAASLNPTYTFGKRADSGSVDSVGRPVSVERTEEATSAPVVFPASPPLEPATGAARKAYSTHGHRTNYMLRPLPPTVKEARAAAAADGL